MEFELNDEQKLLQESVARFVDKEYPFEARKKLAASEDGFSRDHWRQFAELGWLAMALPEDHGGLGGGPLDVAVIMEAFGRGLVLEPFLATVILGADLIAGGGGEAQKSALLPGVGEGSLLLALAYAEPRSRFDLATVETKADKDGGGYRLSGHKAMVLDGGTADKLIVSARTAGGTREAEGVTLFLVDRTAAGLSLRPYRTQDGLRAAEVLLDRVAVSADDVVGTVDGGAPLLEATIDRATVAIAAEAAGCMEALIGLTQEYLKTRKQFGVPIGAFQVLQHRLVDMFMAHELTRALAFRAAAAAAGATPAARARAASAAKVQAGKAGKLVGQQAVQLHGGMGVTDELAVGHYFKRLAMIDVLFGNTDHHLSRFAALG